jgi:hypothetical protein
MCVLNQTVGKGLQRNNVQFSLYAFLNGFSILKPLSFDGSVHLGGKRKNAVKKTGIIVTSVDEVLAWCESLMLLLIHEFVWDEPCADFPFPSIFLEDLMDHLIDIHHSESPMISYYQTSVMVYVFR